ncbi:MAG TPA: nitronate monooxygenase, partial [Longimicrobiales bacterium]
PMAGGFTPPRLVAAACEGGALGSIAGAYLTPEGIGQAVAEVRALTGRPFAVNLFSSGAFSDRGGAGGAGAEVDLAPMLELLGRWHARLGLAPPAPIPTPPDAFEAQLEAVLAARPAVFSFTMGTPRSQAMAALRQRGIYLVGTATTVEEALALEAAGVDAIVAQGSEAGGHRGSFLSPPQAPPLVGTMALVPQVVDAVALPVIASGGIMDGRGLAAALALGACAAQLGTAFLTVHESSAVDAYRSALHSAGDDSTVVTRAFSGRPARGLRNRFIEEVEGAGVPIPPFPLQNALTRPLRQAAAAGGQTDAMSLWAGQGLKLARSESTAALIHRVVREARDVLRALDRPSRGETAVGLDAPEPD